MNSTLSCDEEASLVNVGAAGAVGSPAGREGQRAKPMRQLKCMRLAAQWVIQESRHRTGRCTQTGQVTVLQFSTCIARQGRVEHRTDVEESRGCLLLVEVAHDCPVKNIPASGGGNGMLVMCTRSAWYSTASRPALGGSRRLGALPPLASPRQLKPNSKAVKRQLQGSWRRPQSPTCPWTAACSRCRRPRSASDNQ